MKATKDYPLGPNSGIQVVYINLGWGVKTLKVNAWYGKTVIPLFIKECPIESKEPILNKCDLIKVFADIIDEVPKIEKTAELSLNDWRFKEFEHE